VNEPTIVIDDLHVTYKVVVAGSSGSRVGGAGERGGLRGRLSRARMRGMREVRALQGVSFVAYEGEAIGVVGRNGSGKSTLLRALAGLEAPSRGQVYAQGRPALLGVNAALIPELSGERNVILGALAIGLKPKEVRERYDEIVAFADIGEFIDLPMRTYSSGMGARLRFAIASQTNQRVLLIDEALATGDSEFRERSEARISELRERAGTVFLVTHTLAEIERSCTRCLWIDDGLLRMDGDVTEVLDAYRADTKSGRAGGLGRMGRAGRLGRGANRAGD
jgi:teichoic acid transport system ATP-binding protein